MVRLWCPSLPTSLIAVRGCSSARGLGKHEQGGPTKEGGGVLDIVGSRHAACVLDRGVYLKVRVSAEIQSLAGYGVRGVWGGRGGGFSQR